MYAQEKYMSFSDTPALVFRGGDGHVKKPKP
jgi:hypothetical protein